MPRWPARKDGSTEGTAREAQMAGGQRCISVRPRVFADFAVEAKRDGQRDK